MNASVYHFRLRERVFGPTTPAELCANPLLLHAEALRVKARRVGENDRRPLGSIVNFSGPWRTAPPAGRQPLALPKSQRTTVEQFIGSPKRRGPKPARQEHWTWDEINAGRRFPRSERRVRRLAKSLRTVTSPDGIIQPPPFQQNPGHYFVMGGLLILTLIVAFAFPNGCQGH